MRLAAVALGLLAAVLLVATVAFNALNQDVTVFSVVPAGLALLAAGMAGELYDR